MVNIERAIKDIGRLKKYRKNELLFSAQQKADGLYYVHSGEIRVFKMDEQGREVEVVRLEPGDFLGEAILFVSSVSDTVVCSSSSGASDVVVLSEGFV